MGMVATNATASFRGNTGQVVSATFREMEGYIAAAVIFFVLCLLLERGNYVLSKHLEWGVGSTVPRRRED
jgi:ABC-type amino acid transport system permease subunit